MKDDIPADMKPIYAPSVPQYTGEAEGGPRDGSLMSHNSLTKFIERRIEKKAPDHNILPLGMSAQQRRQLNEAEKAALRETIWARENPHRYDFDPRRKVWVYVEYPTTPLDF